MSLIYSIEFTLKELSGYSIFTDPLELFGTFLILIILGLTILICFRLFKDYQKTNDQPTLSWALASFFLVFAIIFLIIEKLSYSSFGQPDFGRFVAMIASSCVSASLISFNNFAFHITYPKYRKLLDIIVAILGISYILILIYANIRGPPYADIVEFELVYDLSINYLIYPLLIPILSIGPIVFFYFSSKSREESRPNSLRALWLGIGLLCFGLGYIVEVAPFFPPILSIPLRGLFLATAIIMYVCFAMPQWFKNRIGWIS